MKTNSELILRTIAGEAVLVPTGEMADKVGGLISLNPVAEFVWKQIDQASSKDEIVRLVLEEFEVDEETAKQDVYGLINELIQLNMVIE